ncbi:Uncharacterised protein [Moraxella caviae]|nr:Uncharacterised protein [Moraxella caviae]
MVRQAHHERIFKLQTDFLDDFYHESFLSSPRTDFWATNRFYPLLIPFLHARQKTPADAHRYKKTAHWRCLVCRPSFLLLPRHQRVKSPISRQLMPTMRTASKTCVIACLCKKCLGRLGIHEFKKHFHHNQNDNDVNNKSKHTNLSTLNQIKTNLPQNQPTTIPKIHPKTKHEINFKAHKNVLY